MHRYGREDVQKRISHPSQLGGLKAYELTEGRAAGVRAVDFRTTDGLEFTVLLDRAMDISEARYQGLSLCWRSPAGDAAPAFYDGRGSEWLWTFFGGMLTTCGLTQAGPPNVDGEEELGLHGRISTCPAERVSLRENWESDPPMLEVSGVVREARLFGVALEMHRTVRARADGAWLEVRDRIVNSGARPAPLMLLYHINAGFPLLAEGSRLVIPASQVEGRDDLSRQEADQWSQMHAPVSGYVERVYFHTVKPGQDGWVTCALINPDLRGGLGLRLRYRQAELPALTEWKMLGEREYVLGIEPGTCNPVGRSAARSAGTLTELPVGGALAAGFQLDVVTGESPLESLAGEASA